jgi:flavin-dependent dehydrogenase
VAPGNPVTVIGAGPSGLAAAIELAHHGHPVTVYEQHRDVGGRFHGDFQGLENWTREEDVLPWLGRLGITLTCRYRPARAVTLVDPRLRAREVHADRPLMYLIKRGGEPDSLDQSLRAQAEAAGARLVFGRRVWPGEIPGPAIVATGPSGTDAIVAGIVADTSHPDQVVVLAGERFAPQFYAYCIVWDGRATVVSALGARFRTAWSSLARTRQALAQLGLTDFRNERRFGGRANCVWGRSLEQGQRRWVGEAAGLQDYFLGFGLRYAMLSGHLAARAVISGESYPSLIREHLGRSFRAGFVNRLVYDHLGDRGYAWLMRWVARGNLRRRTRILYSLTPVHRALWPLAGALGVRSGAGPDRAQRLMARD